MGVLIIIVVTSPLQAAAEEVFFRGYLSQALGSLVAHPWFGVVVSSVVFATFHGGQNLPLFLDRLAFGLLAGLLVLKTGGLEASIAAHVVTQPPRLRHRALTGTIAQTRGIDDITWANAAIDIGGFAVFAAVAFPFPQASRRIYLEVILSPSCSARCRARDCHRRSGSDKAGGQVGCAVGCATLGS